MQNPKCSRCGGEVDSGKVHAEGLMYYSDWQKKFFTFGILVNRASACLTCGHIELYLNPEILRKKIADNHPRGAK